jgi:hypothetical protein
MPLTLLYTATVYFIFRGRVTDADGYGGEDAEDVQLTANSSTGASAVADEARRG